MHILVESDLISPIRRSRRLSQWFEISTLSSANIENMARFIYEDGIVNGIIAEYPELIQNCHRRITGAELYEIYDVSEDKPEILKTKFIDFLKCKMENYKAKSE